MELDTTTAAVLSALGALLGYQYGSHVARAARRAVAVCRGRQ